MGSYLKQQSILDTRNRDRKLWRRVSSTNIVRAIFHLHRKHGSWDLRGIIIFYLRSGQVVLNLFLLIDVFLPLINTCFVLFCFFFVLLCFVFFLVFGFCPGMPKVPFQTGSVAQKRRLLKLSISSFVSLSSKICAREKCYLSRRCICYVNLCFLFKQYQSQWCVCWFIVATPPCLSI